MRNTPHTPKNQDNDALNAWFEFSKPGDFARAIYDPHVAVTATYGEPIQPGRIWWLEKLHGGADFTFIRGFREPFVLLDWYGIQKLTGAAR